MESILLNKLNSCFRCWIHNVVQITRQLLKYKSFKHLKTICSVYSHTLYSWGLIDSISISTLKSAHTHLFSLPLKIHLKDTKE